MALKLFGASEDAALFVLPLLIGADLHWLKSCSRYAVSFLKLALGGSPSGPVAAQLRSVLDGLAQAGDEQALNVQHQLENM